MAGSTLAVSRRAGLGSRAARRLRRTGIIPGVMYGREAEPLAIEVPARELRRAIQQAGGTSSLLSVEVDGSQHMAVVKEIQRDPVTGKAIHLDLLEVTKGERIEVEVPVVLVGEAHKVSHAGGRVDQEVFSLRIEAEADKVPPHIDVDVSELEVGEVIHLSQIPLPPAVRVHGEPGLVVVVAHAPVGAAKAEEAEEA